MNFFVLWIYEAKVRILKFDGAGKYFSYFKGSYKYRFSMISYPAYLIYSTFFF
jgi:hypothetical protein